MEVVFKRKNVESPYANFESEPRNRNNEINRKGNIFPLESGQKRKSFTPLHRNTRSGYSSKPETRPLIKSGNTTDYFSISTCSVDSGISEKSDNTTEICRLNSPDFRGTGDHAGKHPSNSVRNIRSPKLNVPVFSKKEAHRDVLSKVPQAKNDCTAHISTESQQPSKEGKCNSKSGERNPSIDKGNFRTTSDMFPFGKHTLERALVRELRKNPRLCPDGAVQLKDNASKKNRNKKDVGKKTDRRDSPSVELEDKRKHGAVPEYQSLKITALYGRGGCGVLQESNEKYIRRSSGKCLIQKISTKGVPAQDVYIGNDKTTNMGLQISSAVKNKRNKTTTVGNDKTANANSLIPSAVRKKRNKGGCFSCFPCCIS